MRLIEAQLLARSIMDFYGFKDWSLVWTDEMAAGGRCCRPLKWIVLSGPVVAANGPQEVRELIVHEVAHAMTYGQHGADWVAVCKQLGGTGEENPSGLVRPTREGWARDREEGVEDGVLMLEVAGDGRGEEMLQVLRETGVLGGGGGEPGGKDQVQ